ncbi:MAG: EscU/YscU/HrcU family type III secretion system export apparatus switch protein, partial [Candidatus Riflebacteria bacterium]|nr:EscU/YscU/HrcU family type III secretion system export apparatus switch protein [Candidatus Riflebacteria bacterium]
MAEKKQLNIKYDDVAVAIKYAFGAEGEVPQIVASGRGWLARQIVELAEQNDIPMRKEKVLAESLAKLPVGVEIPSELWGALAEILAQIYLLDKRQRS